MSPDRWTCTSCEHTYVVPAGLPWDRHSDALAAERAAHRCPTPAPAYEPRPRRVAVKPTRRCPRCRQVYSVNVSGNLRRHLDPIMGEVCSQRRMYSSVAA